MQQARLLPTEESLILAPRTRDHYFSRRDQLSWFIREKWNLKVHAVASPTELNRKISSSSCKVTAYVGTGQTEHSEDSIPGTVAIPLILSLVCGLFSGTFAVALLFRRIAIALAIIGPMIFSAIWIGWDWKNFRNKEFALGMFAVGFTLTFLALDREP